MTQLPPIHRENSPEMIDPKTVLQPQRLGVYFVDAMRDDGSADHGAIVEFMLHNGRFARFLINDVDVDALIVMLTQTQGDIAKEKIAKGEVQHGRSAN